MTVSPVILKTAYLVSGLALLIGCVSTAVTLAFGGLPEIAILVWVAFAPVFGLILLRRDVAPRMGLLLLAMGFSGSMAALGAAVPMGPERLEWLPLVLTAGLGWIWFFALTLVALPLLFPTGWPPGPRWRPLLRVFGLLLFVASIMTLFGSEQTGSCSDIDDYHATCSEWESSEVAVVVSECDVVDGVRECLLLVDNPIGVSWIPPLEASVLGDLTFAGLLLVALLALISLGFRMRRGSSLERQQIKYFFLAIGLFLVGTLSEVLIVDVLGQRMPPYLGGMIEFVSWTAIPVSIFLAITRFRLYEIDRLISRTVSYATVIALLVGGVAVLSTVIGTRFESPLVVAGTTLGVAAVFQPLLRRIQRMVDRRFNRSKFDAESVMSEFVGSLRDRVDEDEVLVGWSSVVSRTMQPASLGVWVRRS